MRLFLIFIFTLPLLYAAQIKLNCPEEIFIEEEFECEILFEKNFLSYDVKLTLVGNGSSVNQIWDGNSWQRSDWYVKNLINGEETFARLKIHKPFTGEAKGTLKIRESGGNKLFYEENFTIGLVKRPSPEIIYPPEMNEELLLNSKDIKTKKNTSYLDKNFLSYFGIVFLGIIAGSLYLIREKNGRRKFKEDTFGSNS